MMFLRRGGQNADAKLRPGTGTDLRGRSHAGVEMNGRDLDGEFRGMLRRALVVPSEFGECQESVFEYGMTAPKPARHANARIGPESSIASVEGNVRAKHLAAFVGAAAYVLAPVQAASPAVTLSCVIMPGGPPLPAGFAAQFCAALGDALIQTLDVEVRKDFAPGAFLVTVGIRPLSAKGARILLRTAARGGAVKETVTMISSADAPFSAGSARVLVRPVALALGLQ